MSDRILTLQPIPASAQAIEERLRAIREQTTLSERMEAWRTLAKCSAWREELDV